jgi:hypothetical protein
MANKKNFKNLESLDPIKKTLEEAETGLNDPTRNVKTSSMPEALGAAIGVGVGGAVSFAALYFGGTVGLSAVGITTGLATVGALVGGGMAAGVAVLAAPIAVFGIGGYAIFSGIKTRKLNEAKSVLMQEAMRKLDRVNHAQKKELNKTRERADYLAGLTVLLTKAISDLKQDLAS